MKSSHIAITACTIAVSLSIATETQNTGFRVLPAPGAVAIDGETGDWDLRAGIFACGELEHLRDQFAVWMHAMYDDDNLYVLARWIDPTPMNNPEKFGGHGFNADCLQFRIVMHPEEADETATWWTAWMDAQGASIIDRSSPGPQNGFPNNVMPQLPRSTEQGVRQAFLKNADGKGYAQEIAIPWKLLSVSGRRPEPGATFRFTVEPNFTAGSFGRITIKDIFDERVPNPDRVFTFTAWRHWGWATLVPAGADIAPQAVKTADGRSFPTHLENGAPVVDWTGLIRRFEWPGFKDIAFEMPFDGYVSLDIFDSRGHTVRHLLNWDQREKGRHATRWDGLDDATYRTPGNPLPAGDYTWKAIAHPGARLTFRGYASYGGAAPWSGKPNDTWLGDHGVPSAAVTDGTRMILACNGAEGGRHLLACDFEGKVEWSLQNTTGLGDPEYIATAGGFVYVLMTSWNSATAPHAIAKVDAATGAYVPWEGHSHVLSLADAAADGIAIGKRPCGIAAGDGAVYVSFREDAFTGVAKLDAATGKAQASWAIPAPGVLFFVSPERVLVADNDGILALDPRDGSTKRVVSGVRNIAGLTASADGATIYASLGNPDMQVAAYDAANGSEIRRYGVAGGHPRIGRWNANGMIDPAGIAVDKTGQLWVMEHYAHPKRVSVWNTESGAFVRDFFGPCHYGASGAAINPRDPNLMVGEACEWRLDPATGRSECLGAFDNDYHGFAAFRETANGRQLLFLSKCGYGTGAIVVLERRGDADYKFLAEIRNDRTADDGGRAARFTDIWIDANGDGQKQPGECEAYPHPLNFTGSNSWSLNLGPDMALYGFSREEGILYRLRPEGLAENGAPLYSFKALEPMPRQMSAGYQDNYSCALPDCENKVILVCLNHGSDHPAEFLWHGFDLATGEELWTYPNPYFQVHGSHNAPAPDPGLFRGAYGPVGALSTEATGPFWTINGNLGEWYVLSSSGYFLTQLFSGNVFEWRWPDTPAPGADMQRLPCGGGGEDFGGSATLGQDGKCYIQSGKIGIWNIELENLDKTVVVGEGAITLGADDAAKALECRETALQAAAGVKRMTIRSGQVALTGDFGADFSGRDIVEFKKMDDARVRFAASYDDQYLYLGYEVFDATPWANGAVDFAQLYAFGDTVDFQIGADPDADPDRGAPAKGDLRLSIGNLQGEPTAVIYKFVSDEKKPRAFSSGVVQGYTADFVDIVRDATVTAFPQGDRYVVEAAVPLAALGIKPSPGMTFRGDVGATHGTPSGDDTRLRTYWSNQQTGLTDDVVFELQITPKNWGAITFE